MVRFLVAILIFQIAVCQEQITCSLTSDTFQLYSSSNSERPSTSGSDCPVGCKGEKGDMGAQGLKGEKGEPSTGSDNSNSAGLEATCCDRLEKALRLVADGWKFGGVEDGYLYKLTPNSQIWESSRNICQSLGGDIAYQGIKSIEERRRLVRTLPINDGEIYLGLNDIAENGTITWLDGDAVTQDNWRPNEPSSPGRENCVEQYRDGLFNDIVCTLTKRGLCEIPF